MELPIVSIIIPVYNVQKYIDDCIKSVLAQSFKKWELILVDDGSSDNTPAICDKYEGADVRIHVIHQKNAGVSVARNTGMRVAVGTYIVFVDGDDILPEHSLKNRVDLMKQADMGIAAYEIFGEDVVSNYRMPICSHYRWNKGEAIQNTLLENGEIGYQGYLWNKIFLRSCIMDNNILFKEGIAYNEDRLFVVQYVMHCNNIRLTDDIVYRYRNNPDGAMGSLEKMKDENCDKIMSEFEAFRILDDLMKMYDRSLYNKCAMEAMNRAIGLNRQVPKCQKRLKCSLQRIIRKFGLQAIQGKNPLMKRIKIMGHIVLGR